MRIKSTVLAAAFLLAFSLAGAEKYFYESPVGIGISGGPIGGVGFAYRKHFENRFGLHGAGLVLGGKSNWRSWAWVNAGVQGMYTIHQNQERFFRLYVLSGVGLFADGDDGWNADEEEFNWYITTNVGAGLGMEFLIRETVAISLDSPVTAFIRESGNFEVIPVPGISIVYYIQ
ncbi:MAG: hypothetical protein ACQEQ4_04690 [Fibrobacterota bacterium]